ncbi:hypothetical protein J6V85_00700 [Candidatus Saccharibacteria bacterium]|nr:hypothetical protein [Candidatus Saccharibacteria bacterium]
MNEKKTRFSGYTLPLIKIMSWHDNDLNLDFYDLYLDGNFACRCSDRADLLTHLDCIISGGNRS